MKVVRNIGMHSRTAEDLLDELVQIRRLLTLVFSDRIGEVLSSRLSTKGRKEIWRLLDGKNTTANIAEKSGASLRTVQAVVKDFKEVGLVSDQFGGNPKRVFEIGL